MEVLEKVFNVQKRSIYKESADHWITINITNLKSLLFRLLKYEVRFLTTCDHVLLYIFILL